MKATPALLPAALGSVAGAAYALTHVFETGGWMPFAAVCAITAFAVGALARRLDVPAVLSPMVSLVALVVLCGVYYQRGSTFLGVPTTETLRLLGEQLQNGFADIREMAAPVTGNAALHLVTGGGVFLVAMAVDLVVFSARRPVGAGLPLLILYIVPASMREGIGAVPFVVAALGYVSLLVAEGRERARGWGRRLVGIGVAQELTETSPVSRVGRRLGFSAIAVALVVPAVLPDLGRGLIDTRGGSGVGFGDGPSTVSVINPYVQLKPQLRSQEETELLRVRTDSPQFLRLTSLDRFDGAIWSPGKTSATKDSRVSAKRVLPDPKGLDERTAGTATARIDVAGLKSNWLPVPYAPRRIEIENDWRYAPASQTVFSTRTDTAGLDYTVTAVVPMPDVEKLRAAPVPDDPDLKPYLQLPPRQSELIEAELAAAVGSATTPYDKVVAIQDYFQSGSFTYSTDVPSLKEGNDLDRFLTERVGYCEQFAATMAYMVRLEGLPARVAIGFTPGTLAEGSDDEYVITNKQAHAWPEVYFEGAGWLRFEPTPRDDDQATTDPPPYAQVGGDGNGSDASASAAPTAAPAASADASAAPSGDNDRSRLGDDGEDAPELAAQAARGRRRNGGLLLAILVLAALPAAVHLGVRRWRSRRAATDHERVHLAWQTVADDAEDAGFRLRSSDTPRSAAQRLAVDARLSVTATDLLRRIAQAEERARYARVCPDPAGLDEQVRQVRKALLAQATWTRRVRVALLPASTVRQVRETVAATWDAGTRCCAVVSGAARRRLRLPA